jgi:hypothetical protein
MKQLKTKSSMRAEAAKSHYNELIVKKSKDNVLIFSIYKADIIITIISAKVICFRHNMAAKLLTWH